MHWDGAMSGWGWLMMMFAALFWLLLVGAIIWLIVWLVRKTSSQDVGERETPLDILKKRYARGELSHEDYERMKRELS